MNGLLEEEPPLINTNQNSKIYFTLIYGYPQHIKSKRHDSTKPCVAIQNQFTSGLLLISNIRLIQNVHLDMISDD